MFKGQFYVQRSVRCSKANLTFEVLVFFVRLVAVVRNALVTDALQADLAEKSARAKSKNANYHLFPVRPKKISTETF